MTTHGDGRRFVLRVDEMLTVFTEVEDGDQTRAYT
jgi:hypothetical protein